MIRMVRKVGIAIGSLVIAYLALGLVGGVIGLTPASGTLFAVAVLVLGGLIYRDILRRDAVEADDPR